MPMNLSKTSIKEKNQHKNRKMSIIAHFSAKFSCLYHKKAVLLPQICKYNFTINKNINF